MAAGGILVLFVPHAAHHAAPMPLTSSGG
jgi:hypothetical protein